MIQAVLLALIAGYAALVLEDETARLAVEIAKI